MGKLGFTLVEDSFVPEQSKRWVVVSPPGANESRLLLARASSPAQQSRVGAQTGGRLFLFLYTDAFARDYERYRAAGVEFARPPKQEPYGTVAVFNTTVMGIDRQNPTHPSNALVEIVAKCGRSKLWPAGLFGDWRKRTISAPAVRRTGCTTCGADCVSP